MSAQHPDQQPQHDQQAHDHQGHDHQSHDHQHGHDHGDGADPIQVRFTEEFWEERYSSKPTIWSGQPNPHLVGEAADLEPGLAMDVGCGEGADAVWLAGRGWRVLAVDWSVTALRRGAAHAEATGAEIAERIDWEQHDLMSWDPGADRFDLVSSQFTHLPPEDRDALFRRAAASVKIGGTLLIAAHHPSDLHTGIRRPNQPELFYTGDQLQALLDADRWEVVTNAAPSREATDDGRTFTIKDTVFRARRIS